VDLDLRGDAAGEQPAIEMQTAAAVSSQEDSRAAGKAGRWMLVLDARHWMLMRCCHPGSSMSIQHLVKKKPPSPGWVGNGGVDLFPVRMS
jgi:hypothetical protein